MLHWVILTGEYPPMRGGVSDYTALVARGLAAAGDEVEVFVPGEPVARTDGGVRVHGLPDRFGVRSLMQLEGLLRRRPSRLLVQYVPHAFGWKGMNVPFCLWLHRQRRRDLWVMFHEVLYPRLPGQPWRHRLLAGVTRRMARLTVRAARRVFVSVPGWEPLLRSLGPGCPAVTWLPVPSTIPAEPAAADVEDVRNRFEFRPDTTVLGTFGTFGVLVAPLLAETLPPLLEHDGRRVALLLGRGGPEFACALNTAHPGLRGRLLAPGDLPPGQVAAHLAACDLLLQPYPDGASSRRTSLMAGLALGRPVVTTEGFYSEPLWRESGAVALAPADRPDLAVAAAEGLLADAAARSALGEKARALYNKCFNLFHVIDVLRN
jgi:glycosyltransferase involved in cell wall biosynthesis